MTEAIKEWIADQALKEYPVPPKFIGPANAEMDRAAFSAGLHKGIEIAEGFAEWLDDNYLQEEKGQWYSLGLRKDERADFFTTSQLLEKYIEQLGK